jgi:CPA1 family monovalent cation:H+ antiporter
VGELKTTIELILGLLVAVVFLAALSRRLHIPPPLVLVVAGLAGALLPGVPPVHMEPDLVLLLFLPPLLYGDAWDTSWRDFRANLRPILLLAVGLVFATTLAVGVVAHAALPGLPWAVAFTLGAILSPTDAVASVAIAERLGLPQRLLTIVEGESLVNDASALVAYRFALVAVLTGAFEAGQVVVRFFWVAGAGVALGLLAGWILIRVSRLLTEPTPAVVFSLLAPYFAYLPAEALGASGVLAVVTAGLMLGRMSPLILDKEMRLAGRAVWESVEFLINGLVFIILGLQLRTVLGGIGEGGLRPVLWAALWVAVAMIVARLLWVYPASALPRWLSPSLRKRDPMPSWRVLAVIGWTGLRGAVSLAIALALPLQLPSGAPFPFRAELQFITFVAVVLGLLLQGLTLAPLIRVLGLRDDGTVARETLRARMAAAKAASEQVEALLAEAWVPRSKAERLREILQERLQLLESPELPLHSESYRRMMREVIEAQRKELLRLRDEGSIGDEARRAVEHDLDLEEASLQPVGSTPSPG